MSTRCPSYSSQKYELICLCLFLSIFRKEVEEDMLRAIFRSVCTDSGMPGDGYGSFGYI